jgi:N-ethylmaleimide reductase
VAGWRKVTDAVHAKGGRIFVQLYHTGRVSVPPMLPEGMQPVCSSAVAIKGKNYTDFGPIDFVTPRALERIELPTIMAAFRHGAQQALRAGFDGVEIHGANGYLPAQFLEDGANQRNDQYGGSIENLARFILEITDAVISVWGCDRVCVRLSPRNPFNGMSDSKPEETYIYLIKELEKRKLGILHFMEPAELPKEVTPLAPEVRKIFSGLLILNMGYTQETAEAVITTGGADAISFGTLFISNPDLPERFETKSSLALPDRATMYGGSEKGYTDYSRFKKES